MSIDLGRGGTVGGPPTQTVDESTRNAATHTQQAALGIQPGDTQAVQPFSDLGKQTTWKYQSDSTKPTIPPLITLRTAGRTPTEADTAWTSEFNKLLDELPSDVRDEYLYQSQLPPNERSAAYADLDKALGTMAQFNVWLNSAKSPGDPALQEQNDALSPQMQQAMLKLGNLITDASQTYLNSAGHSDPNFDALSGYTNQLGASLQDLTEQDMAGLSMLSGDVDTWNAQLQSRSVGDNLQILRTGMDILSDVTAASSLSTGAPSLLLGLSIASIGIDNASSAAQVTPQSLENMQNLLADVLMTLLPESSAGNRHLLSQLLTALFLGAISMGTLTSQYSQLFNQLSLSYAINAGIFDAIGIGIARANGANDKTASVAGAIISLTATLLLLQAMAKDNEKYAESLYEISKSQLKHWMKTIVPWMHDALRAGKSDNQIASDFALLIEQSVIALDNDDFSIFHQTVKEAQSSTAVGTPSEQKRDNDKFDKFNAFVNHYILGNNELLADQTTIYQG